MKRLLSTAAIVAALSTPAMADVTIGGDFEWSFQDSNGTSTTEVDADVNIKPKFVTDDGLSVSADFNISQDIDDDGGNSLTLAKDMWKIDMGDVSSATDAIDDVTDFTLVLGNGSPSTDHAVLATIKASENLKLLASYAADTNYGTSAGAGYAYGAQFTASGVTLGAAQMKNTDDSEELVWNASTEIASIGLGYEKHTGTSSAGVDTDTTTMGVTYSINKTTLGVELMEAESNNVISSDETTFGIHHVITDGLTIFVETTEDDKDVSEETTAFGLAMKF